VLIDTHCHLDFDSFDSDRRQVIERAGDVGVMRIVVPALDLKNCAKVIRLAEEFECVYAAVGVHPNSSADWQANWLEELRSYSRHEKVVAIGEIGLDYYRDRAPRAIQRRSLKAQLQLAVELKLPVILHNRQSDADLLELLSDFSDSDQGLTGVLHSFSSDWGMATAALNLGFYLGFSGPVTFKKADELRLVVSRVPIRRIVVETDAPFLAPQQYRGKRNEPAYVALVAQRIASVRNMDDEEIAKQTTENAIRVFGEKLR
jgi:TatD DNase family protein